MYSYGGRGPWPERVVSGGEWWWWWWWWWWWDGSSMARFWIEAGEGVFWPVPHPLHLPYFTALSSTSLGPVSTGRRAGWAVLCCIVCAFLVEPDGSVAHYGRLERQPGAPGAERKEKGSNARGWGVLYPQVVEYSAVLTCTVPYWSLARGGASSRELRADIWQGKRLRHRKEESE